MPGTPEINRKQTDENRLNNSPAKSLLYGTHLLMKMGSQVVRRGKFTWKRVKQSKGIENEGS